MKHLFCKEFLDQLWTNLLVQLAINLDQFFWSNFWTNLFEQQLLRSSKNYFRLIFSQIFWTKQFLDQVWTNFFWSNIFTNQCFKTNFTWTNSILISMLKLLRLLISVFTCPGNRKEAVFPAMTMEIKRFKSPKVGVSRPKVSKQIL